MSSDTEEVGEMEIGLFPGLPKELAEDILVRVPASSLATLRGVSPSWRALISDPLFALRHLRSAIASKKASLSVSLFLIWNHVKLPIVVTPPPVIQGVAVIDIPGNYTSGSVTKSEDIGCVISDLDLPRYFKEKLARDDMESVRVAYTCNGILCLGAAGEPRDHSPIVFFNPALKTARRVSPPPHVNPRQYSSVGEGFGYDSRHDDLKFVRVYSPWRRGASDNKAFVYSLNNEMWREIEIDRGYKISQFYYESAYCHGDVIYWRSLRLNGDEDVIIAFDFSGEKFRRVPLPVGVQPGPMYWNRLAEWKGSLAMFNLKASPEPTVIFEIWAMVSGESWTKVATVGPLENVEVPVRFWNDDELFLGTRERKVISYSLSTKRIRSLLTGNAFPPVSYHFQHYTESLVSLRPRK